MLSTVSFRRNRVRNLILLLLTVGWLTFIFSNSLRNGLESGQQSKRLLHLLQGILDSLGMPVQISEYFLRKLAHFGEYAILSLLLCLDLWSLSFFTLSDTVRRISVSGAVSVLLCFCFATADELLIQNLSKGRGPRFTDVLIDTAGALCAYIFFLCLFLLLRFMKRRKDLHDR